MPGCSQHEHIHYGQEQFIYTLSGRTLHFVNGRRYLLSSGRHLYMEAGVTHNTINETNEPAVELLISTPVSYHESYEPDKDNTAARANIYAAIEAIGPQIMDSFHAPFTIFDSKQRIIFQNNYFSPYCHEKCRPATGHGLCPCLKAGRKSKTAPALSWFICPYEHVVYHMPIFYRSKRIGAIRGGHIVVSEISGRHSPPGVYDTPQSTAIGIQNLLKQVIKSIQAFCAFDSTREELRLKNQALSVTAHHRLNLEKSLRLSENHITDLRINRHFLFNTLNSMADMALQKQNEELYEAICQLSNIFRRFIPLSSKGISLADEIQVVENYLALQKLRYGKKLCLSTSFEAASLSLKVPGNFLQPIVENAFTHGFRNCPSSMILTLQSRLDKEKVKISISNNGQLLDSASLLRIKNGLSSPSGHGLSLIYAKLRSFYGRRFSMDINSQSTADGQAITSVTLIMPAGASGGPDD